MEIAYKEITYPRNEATQPLGGQIVIGFDEWDKKERKVQYRGDSNRFFDYPYTGAVYPLNRMSKWREV